MKERRLAIPIYLNQRIVFDLLAIVEDGFSQLKSVSTSESNENAGNSEISGEVGTKNVFAFLNLGIKSSLSHRDKRAIHKQVQEERVFTPASLFSKLRDKLINQKLLVSLDNSISIKDLVPGTFVEFSGVLKKNPMVANMEVVLCQEKVQVKRELF